jgi:hypothetical protein
MSRLAWSRVIPWLRAKCHASIGSVKRRRLRLSGMPLLSQSQSSHCVLVLIQSQIRKSPVAPSIQRNTLPIRIDGLVCPRAEFWPCSSLVLMAKIVCVKVGFGKPTDMCDLRRTVPGSTNVRVMRPSQSILIRDASRAARDRNRREPSRSVGRDHGGREQNHKTALNWTTTLNRITATVGLIC